MNTRTSVLLTTLLALGAGAALSLVASASEGDVSLDCDLESGVDCTASVEGVTQRRVAVTCDSLGIEEECGAVAATGADAVASP